MQPSLSKQAKLEPRVPRSALALVTFSICFLSKMLHYLTIHLQGQLCSSTMHNLVADEHNRP